ncbi:hypothetical protein OH77DRAFT_1437375 [Trametes cingulata]|nr:hypothetical protein OH77DRAFT_1437375 [Trametes cingulata]
MPAACGSRKLLFHHQRPRRKAHYHRTPYKLLSFLWPGKKLPSIEVVSSDDLKTYEWERERAIALVLRGFRDICGFESFEGVSACSSGKPWPAGGEASSLPFPPAQRPLYAQLSPAACRPRARQARLLPGNDDVDTPSAMRRSLRKRKSAPGEEPSAPTEQAAPLLR